MLQFCSVCFRLKIATSFVVWTSCVRARARARFGRCECESHLRKGNIYRFDLFACLVPVQLQITFEYMQSHCKRSCTFIFVWNWGAAFSKHQFNIFSTQTLQFVCGFSLSFTLNLNIVAIYVIRASQRIKLTTQTIRSENKTMSDIWGDRWMLYCFKIIK